MIFGGGYGRGCLEMLTDRVRELHSYDVPEIIALPISDGFRQYLDWIQENVVPSRLA